jgi:hypothetical protein
VQGFRFQSFKVFETLKHLKLALHATLALERRSGTSCEIVQTYARMISHDWHVQPSCQRPNRGPPERREFSPARNFVESSLRSPGQPRRLSLHTNPTVLETLQTYRAAEKAVNARIPQDFQMISTSGLRSGRKSGARCHPQHVRSTGEEPALALKGRNSMVFRGSERNRKKSRLSARQNGRQEIDKRTCWRSLP